MLLRDLDDVGSEEGAMTNKPKVGEILLEAGIIDQMQLDAALGEQSRWGHRLGITLIKMGMVEEGHLIRALAKQLDLPVASLAGKRIPDEVIALVPERVASEHGVIPLFTKKNGQSHQLFLGMEDPSNLAVLDDLSFRTGLEIHPVMVGPSELGQAIDRYYHARFGGPPATDPFLNADMMGAGSLRIVTDDAAQPGTSPAPLPPSEPVSTLPPVAVASQVTAPKAAEPEAAPMRRPIVHEAPVRPVAPVADAALRAPMIELSERMAELPEGLIEDVATAIAETERTRIVAKAITQLLIQKGLVSLDEIQAQIAEEKSKS
jgi:hypothetical protein